MGGVPVPVDRAGRAAPARPATVDAVAEQPIEEAGQPDHAIGVLADAARALHGQPDLDELLLWAATAARSLTASEGAGVWLATVEGPSPWVSVGSLDPRLLADPRRRPSLVAAARGDESVRVGGLRPYMAVPIVRRDGLPHGIVMVGRTEPTDEPDVAGYRDDDEHVLSALAAHLGVALDNHARVAELIEARREERLMVRELQAAVRPPTPVVPHTELGVFYESAEEEAPSGGDLWDWILLPDGDLHFMIVDVMGKGVEATKDALAVTHAFRMLVLDGCSLETLVQRADSILTAQNAELVATLIVGRYAPATGALVLAGAGHPPALIVGADGVRELAAPGIPIGWPGAGSSGSVETQLQRSETLILYTDGLIEARKDVIDGIDTLKRFAKETAPYPATQQARVLVDRVLSDAARRDDSLALVLRRRTPPGGGSQARLGPFRHRLARSDASVTLSRRLLEDWLRAVPVEPAAVDDLLLAASELCANAVKQAEWRDFGAELRAAHEDDDVVIEVEDDGSGLVLPYVEYQPPPADSERGRGLWLVQTLMDEVTVNASTGRTVVTARKRAVAAHPDP